MASRCREAQQKPSNDLMMKSIGPPPTHGPSASNSSIIPLYYSNAEYENMDNLKESCHEYEDLEFNVSVKGKTKNKGESPKKSSSGHINIKISCITFFLCLIGIIAIGALLLNVLLLIGFIEPKWDCNTEQGKNLNFDILIF